MADRHVCIASDGADKWSNGVIPGSSGKGHVASLIGPRFAYSPKGLHASAIRELVSYCSEQFVKSGESESQWSRTWKASLAVRSQE